MRILETATREELNADLDQKYTDDHDYDYGYVISINDIFDSVYERLCDHYIFEELDTLLVFHIEPPLIKIKNEFE